MLLSGVREQEAILLCGPKADPVASERLVRPLLLASEDWSSKLVEANSTLKVSGRAGAATVDLRVGLDLGSTCPPPPALCEPPQPAWTFPLRTPVLETGSPAVGAAWLSSGMQTLNGLISSKLINTVIGFRTLYKNGAQLLPGVAFSKYQGLSTNLRPSLPFPWVDGTGQPTHPWDFGLFRPTGTCLCILTPCSPAFLLLGLRICRTASPG